MTIRSARLSDAPALLAIYAPYVEHSAVTFEYEVPTLADFSERIRKVQARFPWLVAEAEDGTLLGYAYASAFHPRPAYGWSVETSLYIAEQHRRNGLGRLLSEALEVALRRQNILNLYACIASTEVEDEFLTNASIAFHAALGYRLIGTFRLCGYKFNRWYDMVWMEKHLGPHTTPPATVLPVTQGE